MPKSNESINRELFDLLRGRGYEPTMLDTSGKEIPVPEEAEVFQFDFIKDGKNYGKVTASIDGLRKLIIYFGKDVADSEKESSHNEDISWYQLLNHLKRWAQSRQISFSTRYSNHLKHDMAKRDHMKKKENIAEGYYPMGRNKSYSDSVPAVKIVIEHTRNINEGEQRFRNIARIFVENVNGERFLIPTTKPGLARVYARHIAEGGTPYDDRAQHITSLCEEYEKMAGFVRATKNHQFNEGTTRLVQEGVNHYVNLRETLSRMAGRRGYGAYFESWTPTLMENEGEDLTQLNELFVEETLDPRIENVLPILSRIHKKIDEMKEVDELAEWADSLTEAPGAETLSHNEKTEAGNLKALGLAEDDAEDAHKKSQVPAFMRKKSGDPNWKTTTKDLEKAKERNISGKEGLAALKQRIGVEEGWNDRLDDPDNYEEYLDRLRDLADYNRKRDIEDPPQKHKAPTDDSKKKADESVDDMFSLSGKLPPTDRIDNVSGQDMSFDDKMRASTIKRLLQNNPNLKIEELPTNIADLIKMLDQHPKKNVSEMDNRTPAGDRREQRAYSPEALKQREKELQADLKKVSPEMRKKLRLPEPKEGVAEGSGPKEKQKTPYRDINSPEYRKAADKQKQQMAKDAAAEPGKKLADKIAKKGVTEGVGGWSGPLYDPDLQGNGKKQRYEMMFKNGQVKRFSAMNDNEARKIAAGHGAKSVIKMKGNVPGDKIGEQGVAEGHQDDSKEREENLRYARSRNPVADAIRKKLNPNQKEQNKEQGVAEDLDANQKRVGQLGPTEKVKNNNIGKLVGASESIEAKLKAITEMDKSQPSSDRGGESSGDPYAKGGKATPVKAKDAHKDAEKVLDKAMDKAHKKDVKEGQEDLDAILRIIRK